MDFDKIERLILKSFRKQDIHTKVAKKIFKVKHPTHDQRRVARTVCFGLLYSKG